VELNTIEKANVLNNYFTSVFTNEKLSTIPNMHGPDIPTMPPISLSTAGIESLLFNLDTTKTPGPDHVPSYVLKHCAHEIAPILDVIFKQSLNSGDLPIDCLTANITPVFKKGVHNDPSNFRPISLISIYLLHNPLEVYREHLNSNYIIIDNQHGFRSSHSCQTQLISLVEDITYAMDNHFQVDIMLLDFAKAFDRVPHNIFA